ncbi:MAG: CapA family protein [Candidatus Moraniibacteriota bacterium]|nr:MAG: CapA family protein [Candidatus Moranbacteria bacterium]
MKKNKQYLKFILILSFLGFFLFLLGKNIFPIEKESDGKKLVLSEEIKDQVFQEEKELSKKASVLFVGDVMLDRYIRTVAKKNGYDFLLQDSQNILQKSDAVVMNLEGPITENPSRSEKSAIGSRDNYYFTFDPMSVSFLLKYNMRIAHLGNNHIGNFGNEGIRSTQNYLEKNSLDYFGALDEIAGKTTFRKNIQGVMLSFVSYNQFSSFSLQETLFHIREERKQSDFVIVYTHWGEEYKTISNQKQKEFAHAFIDEGADLIIGSHPHVIQEKEVYKGKTIYYSLGNFIFDQYFDTSVKKGLVVNVMFDKEKKSIEIKEFPVSMKETGVTSL